MNILGISAYYHDAAACLVRDGRIVAAAQEERFTRRKHDPSLPVHAMAYCLGEGGLRAGDLDVVAYYEKPLTKFARLLATYFSVAPHGLRQYLTALPAWLNSKLWIQQEIQAALARLGAGRPGRFLFCEHHLSHAASAFYPSPFPAAAVVTVDGVGEWATTTVGEGRGERIRLLEEIPFPHSLGLLYSALTYHCGFKVNSGEYKLMGLAPYGEPRYVRAMKEHLIELRPDGSFHLNQEYFGYLDGMTMTNAAFSRLFDGPPRQPESPLTRREMDLARSVQEVIEEAILNLAAFARRRTGARYLCLAGGVALNCVANGKVLRSGLFDDLWIQPAAGDAGGAVGAALYAWHAVLGRPREADGRHDGMAGAYLGPAYPAAAIRRWLDHHRIPYRALDPADVAETAAGLVADQKVLGLFHGRMEFGPRALGNRSILGDARSPQMQSILNLKIKYRESFRPFAPACLEERAGESFALDRPSPYMLLVAPVREERRRPVTVTDREDVLAWVKQERSDIPAVTHVDYSARIQTVSRRTNPWFHDVIAAFARRTGEAVVINTSFNVRGEPIVCTPEDAYRCFMRTEMDALLLENFLLLKEEQPPLAAGEAGDRDRPFPLD